MAIFVAKGHSQDPQTMGVRLLGRKKKYCHFQYPDRPMAKIIDPNNFPGLSSQNIRSVDFIYSFHSLFIFFSVCLFSYNWFCRYSAKKTKKLSAPKQENYFFPTHEGQIENSDRKFGTEKFLILFILGILDLFQDRKLFILHTVYYFRESKLECLINGYSTTNHTAF